MTVRIVPLDAGGKFEPGRLERIVRYLEQDLAAVGPPIGAQKVDVIVQPMDEPNPHWEVDGYAAGLHRVMIAVDPRPSSATKAQLRATLAHELHHAVRSQGPDYGSTLGQALVSEGLAQRYEVESGCPVPIYATALQPDTLQALARRAVRECNLDRYEHSAWFYGVPGHPAFPHWGGYSLAYALVCGWLDKNRRTAADAVQVDPSAVLSEAFELFDWRTQV